MTTAPADSAGTLAPAYGDKVIAVEATGSEPVPDAERHGGPLQLLWTWASPNIEFATVFIGVIAVLFFGLSFWQATAAIVLGTALGAITQGVLSLDGPRFGVPQMVIGRLSFGHRGNILPAAANGLVAGVGWFAVNSVSAAFALNTLTGLRPLPSLLLVVAAEILIGFIGHNFVHAFEKYAFPALAVIFLLAGVWTFKDADLGGGGTGGGIGGFLLAFSAAWGYAAGWNPYASDYSRYLPRTANKVRTVLYPALGLFLSITLVAVIGAASATIVAPKDATPTAAFTGHLPGWLGDLVLIAIILGAVSANALNVYSGAISIASFGLNLPAWLSRSVLVVVSGVAGTAAAWASLSDAGAAYEAFLLVIAYWVAPWLGVVLVERWLRARVPQEQSAAQLSDRSFTNWPGLAALLIGVAVSVPLFSNQEDYVGYVPEHWPSFGDITPVVGFALSALLYAALRRRSPAR
ncbi:MULTISPECIES: cytosine permease [Streptomyces]|uniref:Permease for cytosine/purines uracil thiamine allantoin n=1 Tax=Streptomyces sviceus (strain ATCC 29083 / DSM 924 / JCM 4929 / NBRC 13980 / NCIMB 11184 / NRRL 5439 / UC 5370) TaxID=463191 RepID=B5HQJ1_STRX2|nr:MULTISPECIES: cytosine permease [Streptomyces]EDY55096.1 permease for cytosine/purines uracil thiamine allantoin [Streptomyces sviceus ATCC 29083]MYT07629.1 cytosine permease [Streptomyces sp. SID5470]